MNWFVTENTNTRSMYKFCLRERLPKGNSLSWLYSDNKENLESIARRNNGVDKSK